MEFDLIHRYFKTPFGALLQANPDTVLFGIGDDCARLQLSPGHHLFTSTDTLVEGVHFFSDDPAHAVGWKALACNLSDLAACGASPLGFTLNLSLPAVNEHWLAGFSAGLLEVATRFTCPLVGGDTTSAGTNALKTLSITVFGQAPASHQGFNRAHASVGEEIWVSGTPGLARLGLLLQYQKRGRLERICHASELPQVKALLAAMPAHLQERAVGQLGMPVPRLELGLQLRGLASACLDLSDGLSGDLAHIAKASGVATVLFQASLESIWGNLWPELDQHAEAADLLKTLLAQTLKGGDDFELCWTAQPKHRDAIQFTGHGLSCVGIVEAGSGVALQERGGLRTSLSGLSYNHFAESPF
ncbi:MAG: thiamine-phosphate kinase [Burkholderiales bacterium]|uniref:thiamine-phosphate kinase n=1 Tax=Limnobacter sp. TaxID=2003368 RepID=UPI0039BCAC49|nr:thiamine-phosphate kinase [Burkholderiales bacterium]